MQDLQKTLMAWLGNPVVRGLLIIVLAAFVVGLVVRVAKRVLRARIQDSSARYRASKFANVVGYVIVLVTIATQLAGQFSGFALALGAAGAGVAFALQEVIASFAGWLAIVFGGFYNVGDRVQLGGIRGDVIDIGILRTTIMECGAWVDGDLYNGRIVRVANSFVFKEPVFNYSGEFPFLWDEIVLPIKYGSDYELTRTILAEAADAVVGEYAEAARARWSALVRAFRIEDARLEPLVTLAANDNWVSFTLRYIVDHRTRRSTQDALFTRILRAVDATDGKVAMASATLAIVGVPPLRVSLEPSQSRAPAGKVEP